MKISIGDQVYVPARKVGYLDHPYANIQLPVVEVTATKVKVLLRDGAHSGEINRNIVRKKLGFVVFLIGDYHTEPTLLQPLAKSIYQYTRLLIEDDAIRLYSIRSLSEFATIWKKDHRVFSHVILIGHGDTKAIKFGNDWVNASEFNTVFSDIKDIAEAKQVISLCCKTGGPEFGRVISQSPACEVFIGPEDSVHGADASSFYQSYMAWSFQKGLGTSLAYQFSRVSIPGASTFRLFRKSQKAEILGGQTLFANYQVHRRKRKPRKVIGNESKT